jgi:hypothetical protein
MTRSLTRRLLLGTAPAAAAVASVRAAGAAPHPDAELIHLCDQVVILRSRFLQLYCGPDSPDDPDGHPMIGPQIDALSDRQDAIEQRLANMRPVMLEGARAMARAALACNPERDRDYNLIVDSSATGITISALEWLAPEHAVWFATPPAVRDFANPPALPPANPDAELIRICDGHAALIDAVNADPADMDDSSPLWRAYTQSRHAISEAQPQTLAGMMAKARAAKVEARTPNGEEMIHGTDAEEWAMDLVNDLLRIGRRGGT